MMNRTTLITGASSGIGKAAATALAKRGHTIIIHGRNTERTENVAQEIKAATGNPNVDTIVADLSLLREVQKMARSIEQRYDSLDVLINNAGGLMGKEREETEEGIEKTMAINLFAPFLLSNKLLALLKKSPDGRIVNVSSNSHQLNARPDFNDLQLKSGYNPLRAYGNAKLFLIWVTQQLAHQLKQETITNLTANTLHPGAVASNFGVASDLGSVLNVISRLARPFFKTSEQGADTLIYLASSDEVQGISGSYFVNRKPAKVADKYYSLESEQAIWQYCGKIVAEILNV